MTAFLLYPHMAFSLWMRILGVSCNPNLLFFKGSGPQHFWHQGQVSWKTIFPRMELGGGGEGSGGNASNGDWWGEADEASLTSPATHLLLCYLVPNSPRTSISPQGLGTPVLRTPTDWIRANPDGLILTLVKSCLQIQSHSEVVGGRTLPYEFEGTQFSL